MPRAGIFPIRPNQFGDIKMVTKRSADPQHHVEKIKLMLHDVINHVREDIEKVSEPKAQVLFETTAEVLTGLATAYAHYQAGAETAFRGTVPSGSPTVSRSLE
jgi:hypothetical protein